MKQKKEQSTEEIREYYDLDEFPLSSLRAIPVKRPGTPQESFALRLPQEVVEELREMADSQGMGVTQLVRAWVIQRLELERRKPEFTSPVLWERPRATVEEMLPEIVSRVASNTK